MLCGAADEFGNFGTELWLSERLGAKKSSLVVLHEDPRRLIVRANTILGPLRFSVLHAPCEPHSEEARAEVLQWWSETRRLLRKTAKPGEALVLLIDANGAIGSSESAAVGPRGAEVQNFNGAQLHEVLLEHDLLVSATQDEMRGDLGDKTWCSTKGYWQRKDYVAIPSEWASRYQIGRPRL